MAWLRLFQSAVDPSDVEEVRRLFNDDVKPVFERVEACEWIELIVSVDASPGGLVEGCALSRWTSLDALHTAIASRDVAEALVRIRAMLRQEPVTKTYEVLE
jgi:hypothetical protein